MKNFYAKIKAFTLAEVTIVFVVVTVIIYATFQINKAQLNYATKFQSYAAFMNLQTATATLVSAGYEKIGDSSPTKALPLIGNHTPADVSYPLGFCQRLSQIINTVGTVDCSKTTQANFNATNANFTATNGTRFYNLGSNPDGSSYYTVYVDINGDNGNSTLNVDVIPFMITQVGGVVLPKDGAAGTPARNTNYLSGAVRYLDSANYVYIESGVDYHTAVCDATGTYNGTSCTTANYTNYCNGGHTCDAVANKPGY